MNQMQIVLVNVAALRLAVESTNIDIPLVLRKAQEVSSAYGKLELLKENMAARERRIRKAKVKTSKS